MKALLRQTLRLPGMSIPFILLLSFSLPAFAQQKEMAPDNYTGVAIGTGGSVGGKSWGFDVHITCYTTDDQVNSYAQLLKEKGQDALRGVLEKQDCGRINPTGSTGNQIAVARKRQQGANTIITIVTARKMSFGELYNSGRSVDYPFGFLRLTLDAQGKGTGQIMGAASLRFNKKSGKYEIESFGNQYVKAVNVRPNN
jgi:hypothetical protein